MYEILLEGLEFYAYHGVSGEERKLGHRYTASIKLTVNGAATVTDRIEDTVDYGELGSVVQHVAHSSKFITLEHLAERICCAILERFELVSNVELDLAKSQPPMPHIAVKAGVILRKARHGRPAEK